MSFDKEMQKALELDGEKLRQLTGEDHGPEFLDDDADCWMCGGSGILEDSCVCEAFEDTCMCLEPEPRECPECLHNAQSHDLAALSKSAPPDLEGGQ